MTNTEIIISKFRDAIDIEKEYTKIELIKILTDIYKNVMSKTKKNNVIGEKKPPTKYNLYVKDNIPILKKKFPNLSRQDLMRKVSENWKLDKEKSEVADTNNDTKKSEVVDTNNDTKKSEVANTNNDTKKSEVADTNNDTKKSEVADTNNDTKKSEVSIVTEVTEVSKNSTSNTLENETNKETINKKDNKKGKKEKK